MFYKIETGWSVWIFIPSITKAHPNIP